MQLIFTSNRLFQLKYNFFFNFRNGFKWGWRFSGSKSKHSFNNYVIVFLLHRLVDCGEYFLSELKILNFLKIDSAARCNISEFPDLEYLDAYHTCGVFATLSFLLINSVSNSRLDDDLYDGVSFLIKILKLKSFLGTL